MIDITEEDRCRLSLLDQLHDSSNDNPPSLLLSEGGISMQGDDVMYIETLADTRELTNTEFLGDDDLMGSSEIEINNQPFIQSDYVAQLTSVLCPDQEIRDWVCELGSNGMMVEASDRVATETNTTITQANEQTQKDSKANSPRRRVTKQRKTTTTPAKKVTTPTKKVFIGPVSGRVNIARMRKPGMYPLEWLDSCQHSRMTESRKQSKTTGDHHYILHTDLPVTDVKFMQNSMELPPPDHQYPWYEMKPLGLQNGVHTTDIVFRQATHDLKNVCKKTVDIVVVLQDGYWVVSPGVKIQAKNESDLWKKRTNNKLTPKKK